MVRLVFFLLMLDTAGVVVLSLLGQGQPDWDNAAAGESSTFTTALYYGYALLGMGYFALVVASYIVLIMWLRRAYYNLHQLPNIHPDYSDGWAAGAWFVPFVNFVRPFTIMREVWQDTQRAALGRVTQPSTILNWWWASFILTMVVGRITSKMGSNDSAGITQTDLLASVFDAGSHLISAFLTWYVIGRVAKFEQQLTLRQQVDQLGQSAAPFIPQMQAEQSDYALEEGY
jgi:hypothetical protein